MFTRTVINFINYLFSQSFVLGTYDSTVVFRLFYFISQNQKKGSQTIIKLREVKNQFEYCQIYTKSLTCTSSNFIQFKYLRFFFFNFQFLFVTLDRLLTFKNNTIRTIVMCDTLARIHLLLIESLHILTKHTHTYTHTHTHMKDVDRTYYKL